MMALSSWVTRPRPVTSWIVRLVLTMVTGFWTWFSLVSGFGEMDELGFIALLMHLLLPVSLSALLVICWRWELVGGILLICAALVMTIYFRHLWPPHDVLLYLEDPLALMGILLIVSFFRVPAKPKQP